MNLYTIPQIPKSESRGFDDRLRADVSGGSETTHVVRNVTVL